MVLSSDTQLEQVKEQKEPIMQICVLSGCRGWPKVGESDKHIVFLLEVLAYLIIKSDLIMIITITLQQFSTI